MKHSTRFFISHILATLVISVSLFFTHAIGVEYAHAGGVLTSSRSLSGDEVCGASSTTKCTLNDAKQIIRSVLSYILALGIIVLTCFIIFRLTMGWFALRNGNPNAIKEAGQKAANAIIGFLVIAAVIGGLYVALLNFLGVDTRILQIFSGAFVETAYAGGQQQLPNPIPGTTNLYDFVLLIVTLIINWFVYPGLVAMWVWSGFSLVAAQGRPDELKKAKTWLMWAVIITMVIVLTQAFLVAIRGTVNQILPS